MSDSFPIITSSAAVPLGQSLSLALVREVTCIRSMAWRCDLPVEMPWERLSSELRGFGLSSLPAVRGLVRFANSGNDEIVLVPATGRVQIRVHYTVPEHERRFAAERLFQILVYAIRALRHHDG